MGKDKAFDCVELQHRGAERIKKQIDGMTIEQQLEYWRERTEEFKKQKAERE